MHAQLLRVYPSFVMHSHILGVNQYRSACKTDRVGLSLTRARFRRSITEYSCFRYSSGTCWQHRTHAVMHVACLCMHVHARRIVTVGVGAVPASDGVLRSIPASGTAPVHVSTAVMCVLHVYTSFLMVCCYGPN